MKIDALEAYILQTVKDLIGYLVKRGAAIEDARDIGQDTLVKILEIEEVLPIEKIRPWIYRVGINRFLDIYRQKQRQQAILQENLQALLPETTGNLDYSELRTNFAQLDFFTQTILAMKYVDNYSLKEMAFLLNRPAESLKTELYRARNKLRKQMEEGQENGKD